MKLERQHCLRLFTKANCFIRRLTHLWQDKKKWTELWFSIDNRDILGHNVHWEYIGRYILEREREKLINASCLCSCLLSWKLTLSCSMSAPSRQHPVERCLRGEYPRMAESIQLWQLINAISFSWQDFYIGRKVTQHGRKIRIGKWGLKTQSIIQSVAV